MLSVNIRPVHRTVFELGGHVRGEEWIIEFRDAVILSSNVIGRASVKPTSKTKASGTDEEGWPLNAKYLRETS